ARQGFKRLDSACSRLNGIVHYVGATEGKIEHQDCDAAFFTYLLIGIELRQGLHWMWVVAGPGLVGTAISLPTLAGECLVRQPGSAPNGEGALAHGSVVIVELIPQLLRAQPVRPKDLIVEQPQIVLDYSGQLLQDLDLGGWCMGLCEAEQIRLYPQDS